MEEFRGQIQIAFRYSEHLGPRFEAAGVFPHLSTHDRCESGYNPDLGIRVLLDEADV